MQEIINCPGCQKKLQIPETLLGKEVQCPTCGTTFQAALDQQPAPPRVEADSQEFREESAERPTSRGKRRRYDEDDDDDRDRRRRRDLDPHRGGMILTLGILSIVFSVLCAFAGVVLGPIAWVMGNQDMAAFEEGRLDPDGEGSTNAGRICGIVGTILSILGIALGCAYVVFVVILMNSMRR